MESLWLTNSIGLESKYRMKKDGMTGFLKAELRVLTIGEMPKVSQPTLLMTNLAQRSKKKPLVN